MLDEAQGIARTHGYATGGWVAAPVAKRVIERIAPILRISPVDENSEPMRQRMAVDLGAERPKEHKIAAH